jgi:hypothetical protein
MMNIFSNYRNKIIEHRTFEIVPLIRTKEYHAFNYLSACKAATQPKHICTY